MSGEFTFGKEERLKSNLTIQGLLKRGKAVSSFPLKIYWDFSPDSHQKYPVRAAITVPKRKFRRAVDRNSERLTVCTRIYFMEHWISINRKSN